MNANQNRSSDPLRRGSFLLMTGLACAAGVYVSFSALYFRILSFDGAFNTQAAINLFLGHGLTLNYGDPWFLQTGLPFQILNGALLTLLGRSFFAAALANLCFYWALFFFSLTLARKHRSILPLLSFIALSFIFDFDRYAFRGLGEIPALTLALFGAHLIFHHKESILKSAAGWALIGLAAATKWVLMLALPPVLCLSLLMMVRGVRKPVISGWIVFLATVLLCLLVQYASYDIDEIKMLSSRVADQGAAMATTPGYFTILANRLQVFYEAYARGSGFHGLAVIKILAFLLVGGIWIKFILRHAFKASPPWSGRSLEFLFLSMFSTAYFIWWALLAMKPWYRMVLNADILLLFSLALLASRDQAAGYRIRHRGLVIILCVFASVHALLFFSTGDRGVSSHRFESRLRDGLKTLPPEFTGFGYGWWQAPRWSFLADETFYNLYQRSALYPYLSTGIPSILFFEDVNKGDEESMIEIENRYALEDLFIYKGFRIARITGLDGSNKAYAREIDFSQDDSAKSTAGFFDRLKDQSFLHAMPDAAVFLDNTDGKPVVQIDLVVARPLEGKTLKIAVWTASGGAVPVRDFVLPRGPCSFHLSLPEHIRGPFGMYLLLEEGVGQKNQKKRYSVAVRRVALADRPENSAGEPPAASY